MNIFICEDDPKQLNMMTQMVTNYIMIEQHDLNLYCASRNPEEIMAHVERSSKIGIYFLDIQLNHEMNGFNLAQKIRAADPLGTIVFVTSHSELTYLTFQYKIAAMDFILKDEPEKLQSRMIECINLSIERLSHLSEENLVNKLEIKSGSTRSFFDYDDIYFFESSPNPHRIILHLKNRRIEFYGSLKDYDHLDPRFLRCHHSYIINKDHVTSIDKKERIVHFDNQETCYISVRNIKKL